MTVTTIVILIAACLCAYPTYLALYTFFSPPLLELANVLKTQSVEHSINADNTRLVVLMRGVQVTLYKETEVINAGDHDRHRHYYIAKTTLPNAMAAHKLDISRITVLERASKLIGAQDVKVGHKLFDDIFIIKTNEPQWLRSSMTQEVIALHIRRSNLHLNINASTMTIKRLSAGCTTNELIAMMDLLATYALAGAPNLQQRLLDDGLISPNNQLVHHDEYQFS